FAFFFCYCSFFCLVWVCLSWLCSCMCRLRVKGECDLHECILPLTRTKTTHDITVLRQAHPNRKRRKTKNEVMSGVKSDKWKVPAANGRLQPSKRTMPLLLI